MSVLFSEIRNGIKIENINGIAEFNNPDVRNDAQL